MRSLRRLCDVNLVQLSGSHYVITSYLKYQTSSADIQAKRAAATKRKQRSRGSCHAVTPSDPNTEIRGTEIREQRSEVVAQSDTKPSGPVACPPELDLTKAQKAILATQMVPGWAVERMVQDIRFELLGDQSRKMPLDKWPVYMAKAVNSRWSDPNKRPKKNAPTDDFRF